MKLLWSFRLPRHWKHRLLYCRWLSGSSRVPLEKLQWCRLLQTHLSRMQLEPMKVSCSEACCLLTLLTAADILHVISSSRAEPELPSAEAKLSRYSPGSQTWSMSFWFRLIGSIRIFWNLRKVARKSPCGFQLLSYMFTLVSFFMFSLLGSGMWRVLLVKCILPPGDRGMHFTSNRRVNISVYCHKTSFSSWEMNLVTPWLVFDNSAR